MRTETQKEKTFTAGESASQPRWFGHLLRSAAAHPIRRGALLYWAVLLTLSATAMHAVAIVNRLPPSGLLAVLLVGFTIVQAAVALAVVVAPGRRLLFAAGGVEAIRTLAWIVAHDFRVPDGLTVWRPETLGVPDLYLQLVEALSAVFFLCLAGRTWSMAPRWWRIACSCCTSSSGSPVAMDISEPSAGAARPAPVVVYIHGGETLVGSRILEDGTLDGSYFAQLRADLLARGFIVGSIDYGLVPLYHVGEQVQQARCAVRFLRAHASALGLDANRIGVYGPSQGGYISALLGTLGPDPTYDAGQYLSLSSRVQAVVDMWGFTDLTNLSGSPGWVSLLRGGGTPAQLREASPLYHVAPGDPPFLILHGADDWFIAPHHSLDLAKRLQAAGVPVTLVMIQHDEHGLAMAAPGQVEQPSPATLIRMIATFFSRTLAA